MAYHRLLKWGLGVILFLFIILQAIILFWINPVIERGLTELVSKGSKGAYQLSSVKVNLRLLTGNLILSDLLLEPDSIIFTASDSNTTGVFSQFSVNIPRFSIRNLNYRKLWYKDVLDIQKISLHTPEITYEKRDESPVTSTSNKINLDSNLRDSLKNFDLYSYISPLFKGVSINQILLEDGIFRYRHTLDYSSLDENKLSIDRIYLNIEQFYLDSITQVIAERPFFAKKVDISIGVSDYSWILPDSTYKIEAETLSFSSDSQLINAYGLSFHPILDVLRPAQEGKEPRSALLGIDIPNLMCRGLNLEEIIYERRILLDHIRIQEPNIYLLKGEKRDPFLQKSFPDPYDWIIPFADSLTIQQISVQKGNFNIIRQLQDSASAIFAKEITAFLSEVRIDSLSRTRKNHLLFSKDLTVQMKNFGFRSKDEAYLMRGDSAHFSLSDKHALLSNFWLIPQYLKEEDRIEAHVPSVELVGVDPLQVWREGILALDSLIVLMPEVSYTQYPGIGGPHLIGDSTVTKKSESSIDKYLTDVNLNHFKLVSGTFYLNDVRTIPSQEFQAHNINLSVNDLQLEDLVQLDRRYPFRASDIAYDVYIRDYRLTLPDSSYSINLDQLYISSKENVVKADTVSIYPVRKEFPDSNQFNILIPNLILSGIDLEKVYKTRRIDVDSVWILFPGVVQQSIVDVLTKDSSLQEGSSLKKPTDIDLFQHIEPYLEYIKIDYLTAYQANFQQNKLVTGNKVPSPVYPILNLTFHHFLLDSSAHISPEHMFYAEDIEIEIEDYTFPLADSVHELGIRGFSYSTEAQSLYIDSIVVHPKADTMSELSLHIDLPKTYIESINLYDIWEYKIAHLSCITIDAPNISANIHSESLRSQHATSEVSGESLNRPSALPLESESKVAADSLPKIDLYKLIHPYLYELTIDTFLIEDGRITLHDDDHRFEDVYARDIVFSITEFEVDSIAHEITDRPFYANDISLGFDIQEYTLTLPDSSYQIRLKDIGITTADSMLYADEVALIPMSSTDEAAVKGSLTLDRVQLEGLNPTELYFDRILHLDRFRLISPEINIQLQRERDPDKKQGWGEGVRFKDIVKNDPYERLVSPFLRSISLNEIVIEEGRVEVTTVADKQLLFPKLNLTAYQFVLDKNAYDQLENSFFFAEDLELSLFDYEIPLPDTAMYQIKADEIYLSSRTNNMAVNRFQVIPKYSKADFAAKKGVSVDRFDVENSRMEVRGLDVKRLFKQKGIKAEKVHLINPDLYVYKNKNYPFPDYKRPELPTTSLRNLEVPLTIDTVLVSSAQIRYDEQVPDADTVGYFTLDELDIDIFHISNEPDYHQRYPVAKVNGQGIMLNEASMDVSITWPLKDTSNHHYFSAKVGAFPGKTLNALIEPIVFVRISDGYINKITMDFEANNQSSKGKMRMYYDDLKIALMDHQTHQSGFDEKLGSAIANAFVVRKRNPKHRILRVGKIEFEREIQKAFITYWVKSIVEGLKSSVGLTGADIKIRQYE